MINLWQALLILFAIIGFTSFAWAIKSHFLKIPSKEIPLGMKMISAAGLIFFVFQLIAIFITQTYFYINLIGSLFLYATSLLIFAAALKATNIHKLTLAYSDDQPNFLITKGIYKFVRHPFYTAYTLYWLAGIIATSRWFLIPMMFMMFALYWRAAKLEEGKFFSGLLKDNYQSYKDKTGMFIPKVIKH